MSVLAWHFVGATLRDGRPVPPDGETLRHDGPLRMCQSGLHASERLIDALRYAPGATICRVQCGGEINRESDKLVCTERTILWRIDGSDVLHAFARACALDVAHLWGMPDVIREYLTTGDRTMRDDGRRCFGLSDPNPVDTARQCAAVAASESSRQIMTEADEWAAAQWAIWAAEWAAVLPGDTLARGWIWGTVPSDLRTPAVTAAARKACAAQEARLTAAVEAAHASAGGAR